MSLTELNNGEIVASFTLSSPAISTSIYFDFLLNCNKNGRYQDLSLLNESCEICDSDKLCDNHPNCSPGDIERYPLSDNISCFMIKNPGGYSSTLSSGIWEKCKSPCKLCSSNIDTCETCVFGYYLTSVGCINDITSYYKQSKSNNYDPDYYEKCDVACHICSNSTHENCTECSSNYYPLIDNSNACYIIEKAPIRYYFKQETNKFEKCDVSCFTCEKTPKECTKCEDRYFPLEDNKKHCFDVCPVGYIRDENREICKKCPPNCDKCTFDNKCTLCSKDNFLNKSDKLCNKTCERTYWPNSLNRQCDDCIPPCKECSDIKRCISCVNSLFLSPDLTMEDNCLTVCPNGHYANSDNNKCDSCKKGCKLCSSIKICKSCDETFNYLEQKHECLAICPDRYYSLKKLISASNLEITESMRTCEKCQTGCLTCKDTSDFCTSCEIGLFRLEKENKCFNNCPVGYYNNFNINICSKCHPTCKTCIEDDESSCLTCDLLQDLVLNKGYCISKGCPPEHIFMEDDNACKKLADCLENVELSVPKIFNIETSPMVVKYYIKFSKLCSTIVDKFSVDWNKNSSLYNEAVISNDKKNYTLSSSLLDEGLLNFKIDIFFSDKIFTSIESQAKLILNKVKIIIFIFS